MCHFQGGTAQSSLTKKRIRTILFSQTAGKEVEIKEMGWEKTDKSL